MTPSILVLGLLILGQGKPPVPARPETAADVITLRDGSIVLGQVGDSSPRGPLVLYVRRAWAEAHLPERAKQWAVAEVSEARRASRLRRDRLASWKRERQREREPDRDENGGGNDPIGGWLDQELERLEAAGDPAPAPLLVHTLNRTEVKGLVRRPKSVGRMLRQGWLSGFDDVESMSLADLRQALEGRGFAVGKEEPVDIERLLPLRIESEEQWLIRRGATEVTHEPGLRFLQVQGLLLPEPAPGQALTMNVARSMLAGLAPLLEDKPADPLAVQLKNVAARGRVGAVLTQQEMSPGLDAVRITISLWIRNGDRWSKAGAKTAAVRTDALKPGDGNDLARDPQLGAVFQVFESVGLGLSPDIKQQSLNIGVATRKALGMARAEFADTLATLALSLEANARPPASPPTPAPAPAARQ